MRIEFTKDAQADGVAYKKGDDATVSEVAAEKLIRRGYAKKWTAKKVKVEKEDGAAAGE